jgi:hypothetical protein
LPAGHRPVAFPRELVHIGFFQHFDAGLGFGSFLVDGGQAFRPSRSNQLGEADA